MRREEEGASGHDAAAAGGEKLMFRRLGGALRGSRVRLRCGGGGRLKVWTSAVEVAIPSEKERTLGLISGALFFISLDVIPYDQDLKTFTYLNTGNCYIQQDRADFIEETLY